MKACWWYDGRWRVTEIAEPPGRWLVVPWVTEDGLEELRFTLAAEEHGVAVYL